MVKIEHGHARVGKVSPTHLVWQHMMSRCNYEKNIRWPNYGGRGIKICWRWHIFRNFLADMGERPSREHSIDRIDNNGDYEPGNCRWATRKEQCRNRKSNRIIEFQGQRLTLAEWSERTGIKSFTIAARIDNFGWSVEKALTQTVAPHAKTQRQEQANP